MNELQTATVTAEPLDSRMVTEADEIVGQALWMQATVGRSRVVHVAVVHGSRAVIRVMAAGSCRALTAQLARYVRQNAGIQLRPDDARRVDRHLDRNEHDAAVDLYFSSVGDRWDREWLVRETIEVEE